MRCNPLYSQCMSPKPHPERLTLRGLWWSIVGTTNCYPVTVWLHPDIWWLLCGVVIELQLKHGLGVWTSWMAPIWGVHVSIWQRTLCIWMEYSIYLWKVFINKKLSGMCPIDCVLSNWWWQQAYTYQDFKRLGGKIEHPVSSTAMFTTLQAGPTVSSLSSIPNAQYCIWIRVKEQDQLHKIACFDRPQKAWLGLLALTALLYWSDKHCMVVRPGTTSSSH